MFPVGEINTITEEAIVSPFKVLSRLDNFMSSFLHGPITV
jgi:hypothetical protein